MLAMRAVTLLLIAQSQQAAAVASPDTGVNSTKGISLGTNNGMENFDSNGDWFYGKPGSGDLVRVSASTGAVETVLSYATAVKPSTGWDPAIFNGIRFNRDDRCKLYVSFNQAGPGGLGPGGGVAIFDACAGTTPTLKSYTDMTSFGGPAPVVIADVVEMPNGQVAASALLIGGLYSINADGKSPTKRGSLTNCSPNGLENTGTYILVTCFQFPGTPTPTSYLKRWDPTNDAIADVAIPGGYTCQADDMTFDASKTYLYIACGNSPGLTYANRVVALKSTDNWATAEVVWTAKSGCASVAAAAFIGSDLYNICFLFDTHVYKHTLASFLVPLPPGAIAGIVVAAVAVLVIALAAIKYFRGKQLSSEEAKAAPTMQGVPDAQGV